MSQVYYCTNKAINADSDLRRGATGGLSASACAKRSGSALTFHFMKVRLVVD